MAVALVVREWEAVKGLCEADQRYLQRLVLRGSETPGGQNRPVFAFRNGVLYAQNYVGIVETPSGTVIEILPKVDLGDSATRTTLLSMLRDSEILTSVSSKLTQFMVGSRGSDLTMVRRIRLPCRGRAGRRTGRGVGAERCRAGAARAAQSGVPGPGLRL